MNSEPLLLVTPSGDVLKLRPEGQWTAANVSALETLSRSVGADVDRSRAVTLDMSGVSALDTLGAWVLEKLSRRAASSGRSAELKFCLMAIRVKELLCHRIRCLS